TVLMSAVDVATRHEGDKIDHSKVVNLLLERGADIEATGNRGETALMKALEGIASESEVIVASPPIVQLLLTHGANVNARDKEGQSPLTILVSNWESQPELAQLLLDKGADIHARTKDGRTVLMIAAGGAKEKIVPLLLMNGADLNAQDDKGQTALMKAAQGGWPQHLLIVKLLLDKRADVNV